MLAASHKIDLLQQTIAKTVRYLVYVFIFSFLINLLVLTSSIYMMQVFDRVMASQSLETLAYLTLIAVFALVVMSMLDLVRSRILTRIGTWFETQLGAHALRRAVDAALTGQAYRTEALRDLATIRNLLAGPTILTICDVIPALMFLTLIYMFHPMLGHLTLAGAAALLAVAFANDRATHKPLQQANQQAQQALNKADAAMRNAEALDVMGMTPSLVKRWQDNNKNVIQLQTTASDRSANASTVSKFIRLMLQILVLAVGAYYVLQREMTSGQMMAASIIMSRALAPVEQAISAWRQVLSAIDARKRLKTMLAQPLLRAQAMQLPAPKGTLAVEGVTYIPAPNRPPILKNVSMLAPAGSVTAIVGPSAAGKSTLARLCVGAYPPTHGNVRLDGADVFLWDRTDFSQHVGYLPQDVALFSGTVRENIARFLDAEPLEVVEAAQHAGVHEMILRLPQGYETEVGDNGTLLSGGQRQRIAFARALFRSPKLIVLDEPNSSLDAEGEAALNNAIGLMKSRGSTIIMVGHRPSILVHVDTIVVMRDGRVDLMGPRDEVARKIAPPQPAAVSKTVG